MIAELAQDEQALIVALTESHLSENIKEAEIKIDNYIPFRTDRANNRKKGGVITYIKNSISPYIKVLLSFSNSVTEVQILSIEHINMILIVIYRPPDCNQNNFIPIITMIRDNINELPTPLPTIVLTGDLNFPMIDWESEVVRGGLNDVQIQATALLDLTREYCMNQYIRIPTRGNNILDLFFTNNDELIHEYTVDKNAISDHNIITISTNIKTHKPRERARSTEVMPSLNNLNFFSSKTDWENIVKEISEVPWKKLMSLEDPQDQYEMLLSKCLEICYKYTPVKVKNQGPCKIPRDRRILMRKRRKLKKKSVNSCITHNRELILQKISKIEQKLKHSIDNELKLKEKQAVSAIRSNPKYFYKYASDRSKIKAAVGPLINSQGTKTEDPAEVCEALRIQYEGVFSSPIEEKKIANPMEFFSSSNIMDSQLQDISFSKLDIKEAIRDVSNNAAAGPDGFPAILLKKCAEQLSEPLQYLYRNSLDTGIIPEQLKRAKITPVYKGDSRAKPENYRPIALTSHVIKIFEKLIVRNITNFLETNNKMNENQHGFREGRSCLSQLLSHHEQIIAALENSKNIDVIYLDFSKAFDKVDHGVLLHKLRNLGVTGRLGVWIHNFLKNRTQCVADGGALSCDSRVLSGVPQGSVLGPLLFLIHISDIDQNTQHSLVSSFADDTRVIKEIKTAEDEERLMSDLSSLYSWAEINNMKFNSKKFELIRYGNNINQDTIYTAHNGSLIKRKNHVSDLGIQMSDDATFSKHIQAVVQKARAQAGWVLRIFKTREAEPMLTLYKALVIPHLEYCCQLWNPWKSLEKQALEGIQRSFTSKIKSVKEQDYWERLKSLKLYSLERRRERYLIIYTWKILNNMAPNLQTENKEIISYKYHKRLGRLCDIRPIKSRALTRVKTIKENSFGTLGPKLYNELPKNIRNTNYPSLEKFKKDLDNFLGTILDQPSLPHYHRRAASNSIIDQLAQERADGLYSGGATAAWTTGR